MKKPIVLIVILALVVGMPQEVRSGDMTFDPTVRYSKLVINSCLYHFKANKTAAGFAKYDETGTKIANSESSCGFDYVP